MYLWNTHIYMIFSSNHQAISYLSYSPPNLLSHSNKDEWHFKPLNKNYVPLHKTLSKPLTYLTPVRFSSGSLPLSSTFIGLQSINVHQLLHIPSFSCPRDFTLTVLWPVTHFSWLFIIDTFSLFWFQLKQYLLQ